jgi:hypothetical protein
MRKYLLTAVLVAAFASPALAGQVYVAYDGKRCERFSEKPKGSMNILGVFDNRDQADKAMKKMPQCNK